MSMALGALFSIVVAGGIAYKMMVKTSLSMFSKS